MFSIILGIGLASLFRKVCKDKNCIVLKPPPLDEIQNKYNEINKYTNYTKVLSDRHQAPNV
jgi:hypothetical protein